MAAKAGSTFYVRMGYVLIAFLLAGFIPYIYMRFSGGGTMYPALIVHSLSYVVWFTLFVVQASLVSKRNLKLHRTLGQASLALAVVMTVSALLVTRTVFSTGSAGGMPLAPEHFIILPIMDGLVFPIFYGLGFLNRRSAETHKHYMLLAGILIMDPATGRLGNLLGFPPIGMLFHFGFLAAVWRHDRKTLGGAHVATKVATGVLALRYLAFFVVGPTETWAKFVHWLLG